MEDLVFPFLLPFSLALLGIRKGGYFMNRFKYKEDYEKLNVLIQQRTFLKYMDNDLLKTCLSSMKVERNRRLKIKVNEFLKFNLFKNCN